MEFGFLFSECEVEAVEGVGKGIALREKKEEDEKGRNKRSASKGNATSRERSWEMGGVRLREEG